MHGYYASVSFIDAQVGLLLDELDRRGLRDNTIVMLIGDHGFNLGEQDLWGKHSLYELSLHSPLIVSAPQQTDRGTTSDALVELIDVYPTLSERARLPDPPDVDGRSLVPLTTDPGAPWQAAALSQYRHFMDPYRDTIGYSLRSDRYRYTEWRESGSVVSRELYDFGVIARETANLAADGEYAQTVADMSRQLGQVLSTR